MVAQTVGMSTRYYFRCDLSSAALSRMSREEVAQTSSSRHSGEWNDETGRFSLAKCLEVLVTPRWTKLKDMGNDALKAGENHIATTWYRRAASLTTQTDAVAAFFDALEQSGSKAAHQLAEAQQDLWSLILRHLPDGPQRIYFSEAQAQNCEQFGLPPYVHEPNLPRAICLSNAVAAQLRFVDELRKQANERPDLPVHIVGMNAQIRAATITQALKEAKEAALVCPEYQKAHYRMGQVLKALGSDEQLEEAEVIMRMQLPNLGDQSTHRRKTPAMSARALSCLSCSAPPHRRSSISCKRSRWGMAGFHGRGLHW